MSFKDDMVADMDVFFDLEEYGESHLVAKKQIPCVLYELTTDSPNEGGIIPKRLQLQAERKTLPAVMRAGDTLNIDGSIWTIESYKDELGVAVVTLSRRA